MSRPNLTIFWALSSAVLLAAAPPAAVAEDERSALIEQVRDTELAFAASVMENRPEAFAAFLDEATVFVGGDGVIRGRDAVVAAWTVFFGENRPYFEWHPEIVELSADGSLGLSRGPWTLRVTNPDGTVREQTGLYNSVWRRQDDGSWKIVFDAGCDACPACD